MAQQATGQVGSRLLLAVQRMILEALMQPPRGTILGNFVQSVQNSTGGTGGSAGFLPEHYHEASEITDFNAAVAAVVATLFEAGPNIDITYNAETGKIVISAIDVITEG